MRPGRRILRGGQSVPSGRGAGWFRDPERGRRRPSRQSSRRSVDQAQGGGEVDAVGEETPDPRWPTWLHAGAEAAAGEEERGGCRRER